MAHQFMSQHQSQPAHMFSHQNTGHQRQAPMAQQPMPTTSQQRGSQGQNITQSAFANYDPQFALFTFEKQGSDEGWEDVEAEQQHINAHDLQNDVKKFQRSKTTVKRKMEERSTPSTVCMQAVFTSAHQPTANHYDATGLFTHPPAICQNALREHARQGV